MTNDEAMQLVRKYHCAYTSNDTMEEPTIVDGFQFWKVGHNASHEFYLGAKDGVLYKFSYGETNNPLTGELEYKGRMQPIVGDDVGYIGHF